MYGLVLAGGGAKGAYHLGVWKALKELKIPIGAICGTSIGSINGVLLAQGDYQKLLKLWRTITINDIVETSEVEGDNLFSLKNLVSYVGSYNSEKAVNMKPLEEILNKLVNREKLMKSKIDFGLMTCEMGSMQPVEIFKSEIPADKLVEYLMASARLPGMPVRVIDNKSYLDGAFADNKPVGMLIKQGYRDIISVDVGGMGIVRTALPKGDNIIEINCSENLIGTMEFNRESIAKTIDMGYFDSLRVFGKVLGRRYYLERHDYAKKRLRYSEELLDGIEAAAEIFEVDRYRIYTVEELINATLDAYRMQNTELDLKKLEWSEIIRLDKKKMLVILINSYLDNKLEIPDSKMLKELFKEIYMSLNAILYFGGLKKSPTLPIA